MSPKIDKAARDAVDEMLDDQDEAFEHLIDLLEEPRRPQGLHREGFDVVEDE